MSSRIARRVFAMASAMVLGSATLSFAAMPYEPTLGDPMAESWRWRSFPELDSQGFYCMAEAADGSVLFGVNHGVLRYDGRQWDESGIAEGLFDSQVLGICTETNGNALAFTKHGLYALAKGYWSRLLPAAGDPVIVLFSMQQAESGLVWLATSRGVLQVSQGTLTLYSATKSAQRVTSVTDVRDLPLSKRLKNNDPFTCVFEDRQGMVWIVRGRSELFCWNRKADDGVSVPSEHIDGFSVGGEVRMHESRDGTLWLGSNAKMWRQDPALRQWTPVKTTGPEELIIGSDFLESSDGTLWLGSRNGLYTLENGQWAHHPDFSREIGFRNLLLESSGRGLWVGLKWGKVCRLNLANARSYEGVHYQGTDAQGNEWYLSGDRRGVCKGATGWLSYGNEDGLITDPMMLFCSNDGTVWAAGHHKQIAATAYFKNGTWIRQQHKDLGVYIDHQSVCETSDGSVWFGAASKRLRAMGFKGGLIRATPDGAGDYLFSHLMPPTIPDAVQPMARRSDGSLWLAGGKEISLFRDNRKTPIPSPDEIRNNPVEAMAVDDKDHLWVAPYGAGLYRFDGMTWTNFTMKNGLDSDTVSYVLCGHRENEIWAATAQGISQFDGVAWAPVLGGLTGFSSGAGTLSQASTGIWVNYASKEWYETIALHIIKNIKLPFTGMAARC